MMICFVAIEILKYFIISIVDVSIIHRCYCSLDIVDAI